MRSASISAAKMEVKNVKVLEWYDRFLVRHGIPAVIGIFAVIIVGFALHGQADNAWITLAVMIFVIIVMVVPIGIDVARSGPWEK